MDTLVKKAYDNWMHVIEYDGKSLLISQPEKDSCASQVDVPMASQDYSNSFDQQFLPALPLPVHSDQPPMDLGLTGIYSALQNLLCFLRLDLRTVMTVKSWLLNTTFLGPKPRPSVMCITVLTCSLAVSIPPVVFQNLQFCS